MVKRASADAGLSPTQASLAADLAGAAELWERLAERLTVQMEASGSWQWGGPRSGWELRFKRAGRPFATLTPGDGAFSALVILGRDEAERAAGLSLGERARRTFDDARQYHDGRWLYLRVETADDIDDIVALLLEKLPPTVRARSLARREPAVR